ncbi:MAG TPA: ABC transporter ATP-binding protein, partial [Lautropia sp.]|nr:ABC transporter ATP-binding protein [Lautropia sp.]
MNAPLVDLDRLQFSYKTQENLIDLTSWQLQAGEQILVSGPSGCGKST